MCISAHTILAQVLPFRLYTVEQGLISDAVTSLCQDSKGYLWIGTGEGVSIFDGKSVRNISMAHGLALNNISFIAESHADSGVMLIGTWGGGVTRLTGEAFTSLLPDSTVAAKTILDIQEDYKGTIWCVTEAGLYRFAQGSPLRVTDIENPRRVLVTGDSLVWVATGRHVFVCAPGTGEVINRILIPGESNVTALHEYRKGGIWVANSRGLMVYIVDKQIVFHRVLTTGRVGSIASESDGSLWLGTDSGLVFIRSPLSPDSPVVRYTTTNGLQSNRISACLIDHEENLWIGVTDAGLQKLSERNVYSFPLMGIPESYNNSKAVTDDNGHVWVITTQGLWEIWKNETGNWRIRLSEVKIFSGESMPTIVRDKRNRLWLDTGRRIECYTLRRASDGSSQLTLDAAFHPGIQLPKAIRFFFTLDSKENLWLSILGRGVYRLNVSTFPPLTKHLTQRNGLPSDDIRAMYEDVHGRMWLGSFGDGIAIVPIDGDSVVNYLTAADGLSEDLVRAIAEDEAGRMWVGTRRNGINILDTTGVQHISVQDGLPGATVWALAADNERRLMWVGGAQGVHRIQMTSGRPLGSLNLPFVKSVTSLGAYRGQFLWFVTKDVLTIYEHSTEDARISMPRLHINGVTVSGKRRDAGAMLEFRHDENHATFEYVGVTFRQPEALRYQCRLLGAESDWQSPTAERSVTYAALSPGNYTFQVRAVTGDGFADSVPATLSFAIVPPYWTRWWFIGLSVIILSAAIALVVRMRIARLLEIERLRSRIARDLHDEIGSNLSSIAMASDLLGRHAALGNKEKAKLSEISSVALSTLKDMKDIVWLIRPGNDSLDDLFLRMKDTAAALLDGYEAHLSFPTTSISKKVSLEWKRNLYLIYKEALANIVRHAHATSVAIDVQADTERVTLQIRDNGSGFDPAGVRFGNGLKNIRERADLLNADLVIESHPGQGTLVRVAARIT